MERRVPIPARPAFHPRRATVRRRGSALAYVSATLVALTALASLAVDLGRVYLVRSELQLAADAAARYAAAGFADGVDVAENNAVNAADDNTADGTPVVLDRGEDIEFGTWNASTRQFTPLVGPARSGADAIRVTARRVSALGTAVPLALGRIIGVSTCDASAVSVVRAARRGGPGGFVGLGNMQVGNNGVVAGYNSASGAPGGANVNDDVTIGSNGVAALGNNTDFGGSVVLGPSGTFSGPNADLDRMTATLTYPPVEAPTVPSSGALDVPAHTTTTLPGGTYSYTSITLGQGSTLTFTGPATVYVDGDITTGNNAAITAVEGVPGNLRIRVVGARLISLGNGMTVIADIYAPLSTFRDMNDVHFRGALVALDVRFGNNADLYYDVNLASGSAGSAITILR